MPLRDNLQLSKGSAIDLIPIMETNLALLVHKAVLSARKTLAELRHKDKSLRVPQWL